MTTHIEIASLRDQVVLITGAARAQEDHGRSKIFNAIEVVQGDRIVAFYDKMHLVPFGEYLPLSGLLRPLGVQHLVPGTWDVGEGPRRLIAPGLPPAAPLICYEAIFSGAAVEEGAARPQWLLNVTNDGWFGKSSGPFQHAVMSRQRCIENGISLARCANAGISMLVDQYGRILCKTRLNERTQLSGNISLSRVATVYSRWGDWPVILSWGLVAFMAALMALKKRTS